MQIGERLFSLRQKSGQSLQQVADAVGVSKAHVWELEKGHSQNPSFDLVRRSRSTLAWVWRSWPARMTSPTRARSGSSGSIAGLRT